MNRPVIPPEAEAIDRTFRSIVSAAPFNGRNFSKRVIEALVQAGIDAPERLLFMTMSDLNAIPGIGKTGLTEIAKYRSRFIP